MEKIPMATVDENPAVLWLLIQQPSPAGVVLFTFHI